MNTFFHVLDSGKEKTQKDLAKGLIRVARHPVNFFRDSTGNISVIINNMRQEVLYTMQKRVDILHIGADYIQGLNLKKDHRLKITRTEHSSFLIEPDHTYISQKETDGIKLPGLHALRTKYWKLLELFPFPQPPAPATSMEMIRYFKREVHPGTQIGPYTGISVFEAANRIASDLVIINGVIQLITEGREPEDAEITVRLGVRHEPNKGDFSINQKEGEAFNVATSFYPVKFGKTLSKWKNRRLHYILVNGELFDEKSPDHKTNPQIIPVKDWDIKTS